MKAQDLFFNMISKFHQKFDSYCHKNGGKNSFTTYFFTTVINSSVKERHSEFLNERVSFDESNFAILQFWKIE